MYRIVKWLAISLLCSVSLGFAEEMTEGRLMRFPDIYKDKIVFSYGGDLWLASTSDGVARRITSHPGLELFPKFSPDGKWIAFSGQYDGNFNVYVIPSEGGEPKQLTFLPDAVSMPERMGPNNMVITWFPDSKRILFLSRRDTFNDWFGRLFSVSIDGGLPVRLPLDKGGLTSFSPDGTKIAYNRIFRNFRTWKRYTGGMVPWVWHRNWRRLGLGRAQQSGRWRGPGVAFEGIPAAPTRAWGLSLCPAHIGLTGRKSAARNSAKLASRALRIRWRLPADLLPL